MDKEEQEEKDQKRAPIYIKYYDVNNKTEYPVFVGRIFISLEEKISKFEEEIKKMVGLSSFDSALFYEEIRYKDLRVDLLDLDKSFKDSQIGSGDIITFQLKSL